MIKYAQLTENSTKGCKDSHDEYKIKFFAILNKLYLILKMDTPGLTTDLLGTEDAKDDVDQHESE